jgi:hypothetical protein
MQARPTPRSRAAASAQDTQEIVDRGTWTSAKRKLPPKVVNSGAVEDEVEEPIDITDDLPEEESVYPSEDEENDGNDTLVVTQARSSAGRKGSASRATSRAPSPDRESSSSRPAGRSVKGKSRATPSAFVTPDPEDDVFSKIAARAASTVAELGRTRGGAKVGTRKSAGKH